MSIEDTLTLSTGGRGDYEALREHHYRAARPATMTRVLALHSHRPTVIGRFLQRVGESQTVAVLVESLPSLSCRLRNFATDSRYAALGGIARRAKALNAEVRCISRVIVDPQWRGLGLAVRLVRAALHTATTPLTEAIAAMGSVHPFFEQAGMTPYRAPHSEHDARLLAALHHARLSELDLALIDRFALQIELLGVHQRGFVLRELKRWFARTMIRQPTDLRETLVAARQWLLCDPVYYLHANRTEGRNTHGTDRDPAFAAAPAPDEQQRDAGGAAQEAGGAHRADGEVSAGGGEEVQC